MKCFYAIVAQGTSTVTSIIEWDTTRPGRPPVNGTLVLCSSNVSVGQTYDKDTGQFEIPVPVARVQMQVQAPESAALKNLTSAVAAVEALIDAETSPAKE